jgi:cytidylate kinase
MDPQEARGMNHLKMVQQFLTERRDFEDLPEYGFPFVTISRQAGAGGHLLSYVIVSEFLKFKGTTLFEGWHVFDKDLCEVIAKDPQLQVSMEDLVSEKYRSEFREFIESLFTGQSKQYLLYKTTFKVVRMLSVIGKVVIVGRGSALVTADLPQGIHLRLVAPKANRIVWMMKRFKLSKEAATKAIDKQDADRRKLIKLFFHRDIEDPLLYDAVWNTGKVPLEVITRATLDMIRERAKVQSAGKA